MSPLDVIVLHCFFLTTNRLPAPPDSEYWTDQTNINRKYCWQRSNAASLSLGVSQFRIASWLCLFTTVCLSTKCWRWNRVMVLKTEWTRWTCIKTASWPSLKVNREQSSNIYIQSAVTSISALDVKSSILNILCSCFNPHSCEWPHVLFLH